MKHKWTIIVRAVNDSSGKEDLGLSMIVSDRSGVLPNKDEESELKSFLSDRFFDQHGVNPSRISIAVLPWLPEDGDLMNWKEV